MLKQSVGQRTLTVQILPPRRGRERQILYRIMGRLIWMQYCQENRVVDTPFEQAPADVQAEILHLCEALCNMVLIPDLRDTAEGCLADAICRGTYLNQLTLDEVSAEAAMQYLTTAQQGLRTFFHYMQETVPDQHYRDSICRKVDALAPKKGVH